MKGIDRDTTHGCESERDGGFGRPSGSRSPNSAQHVSLIPATAHLPPANSISVLLLNYSCLGAAGPLILLLLCPQQLYPLPSCAVQSKTGQAVSWGSGTLMSQFICQSTATSARKRSNSSYIWCACSGNFWTLLLTYDIDLATDN